LAVHRAFQGRRASALAASSAAAGGACTNSPSWARAAAWAATMAFVLYGWLLFRARSVAQIVALTRALGNWAAPAWLGSAALHLTAFALPLLLIELWQYRRRNLLAPLRLPRWPRAVLQAALLLAIVMFWEKEKTPFIYFQF
jgi:alginate O-acetyltransferase complex protein AlgI